MQKVISMICGFLVTSLLVAAVMFTGFFTQEVLPFLGAVILFSLFLLYGEYLVRLKEREDEHESSVRRRVADAESAQQQEAYFHARGLCLNCNPRLDGKHLEMLRAVAVSNARLTLQVNS